MSSDWREGNCSAVTVSKSPFKSPRTSSFPKISIFRMSVKTAFRNMAVMAATQGAPRLVPWASSERAKIQGWYLTRISNSSSLMGSATVECVV